MSPLVGCEGGGRSGMVVSQGRPVAVVLMVAFALQDVFVLTLDKIHIHYMYHWVVSPSS